MEQFERDNVESFKIEKLENIEGVENIHLSDVQKMIINQYVNFDTMNNQELIEEYDMDVRSFVPQLQTNVHLSLMNGYNAEWEHFLHNIEPHYLESIPDKEQVESVARYMCGTEDIVFENWRNLSTDQMLDVLNEMEAEIAKIEHRPSGKVLASDLGETCFGQQLGDTITINTRILEASTLNPCIHKEILNTLIHEGRHMYQYYNVNVRMVHESPSEVESWRENLYELGYHSGEPTQIRIIGPISYTTEKLIADGERLYYYQPVEIDARDFAGDVMKVYTDNMHRLYEKNGAINGHISFKGVNDKEWNIEKAQQHQDWADWYTKKAEEAMGKGDLTKAKDYYERAEIAESRSKQYLDSAKTCTK